ncbi:hypothetical protein RCL_jg15983.t1 [Rhizophagus clarus]|uniref:Uncharacterized protein n=1 Tax=Rhizophagus clarus TaxID=94130 RepID=A0A8H3L9V9_9GLOM|nr:hypothetical protein RCL_jg15983.t1 [Rhizophagus clarus]
MPVSTYPDLIFIRITDIESIPRLNNNNNNRQQFYLIMIYHSRNYLNFHLVILFTAWERFELSVICNINEGSCII